MVTLLGRFDGLRINLTLVRSYRHVSPPLDVSIARTSVKVFAESMRHLMLAIRGSSVLRTAPGLVSFWSLRTRLAIAAKTRLFADPAAFEDGTPSKGPVSGTT